MRVIIVIGICILIVIIVVPIVKAYVTPFILFRLDSGWHANSYSVKN